MKKLFFLLYGLAAYAVFNVCFLYLVGFVGNIFVPKAIDGVANYSWPIAVLINLGLIVLFALQHSIMARPWFKKWWTQYVPEPIERSTYVWFTCLMLTIIFVFWQPIEGYVWQIESGILVGAMWALFMLGWTILFVSTLLLNHFDLFGLRQVWLYFTGKPYEDLKFSTPLFYKWSRHPLYLGLLIAFFAAPNMSYPRLFFAIVMTIYVVMAIQWEEKDLISHFGSVYKSYRERVPMLVPFLKIKKKKEVTFETYISQGDSR